MTAEDAARARLGRGAWALVHGMVYQVCNREKLAQYAATVRGMVELYPCDACRARAAGEERCGASPSASTTARGLMDELDAYARTREFDPMETPIFVKLWAFRLHNTVNAGVPAPAGQESARAEWMGLSDKTEQEIVNKIDGTWGPEAAAARVGARRARGVSERALARLRL